MKGAHLEEYIDETGVKHSIRWTKFIDADGTVLYANKLTGEVIPEHELNNHFLKTSTDGERLREKKRVVEGNSMLSRFFDSDDAFDRQSKTNSASSTATYFNVNSIKNFAKRVILGKSAALESGGRRHKSEVQTEDEVV